MIDKKKVPAKSDMTALSAKRVALEAALERGVIKQSGAWFSFGAEKIGQGRDTVAENLKSNSKLFDAVKEQALAAVAVIPARVTSHQEENV